MDDIIVFGGSEEEQNERLKLVFQALRAANLKLGPNKCNFFRKDIGYLGHILSEKGISPDPKKIIAVKAFPVPKTVKNVKEFPGLTSYYTRFIENYARISEPSTVLLKKETDFHWSSEHQKAFDSSIDKLCTAPILQPPDLNKPFNLTTDASAQALGAVLSQGEIGKDDPIAYASRISRGPELKYDTYEKVALAIIFGVKTFRVYSCNNKSTICTDHKPLLWLKSADNTPGYNNSG